eukprot:CAMPEP_0194213610 /NCGR_PEP_ID=MMETSP0156-20130528/14328_1 /TAXON_ID=33649 /ORGANISM="Thalassionema nitzschioides, Strain L26-B" /LENGTH=408 /DNA_ID=CAMNT_0038941683 /DNA_START=193 /DNA_END=1419 /DNA_ORIENTATION=+
MSTWTDAEVEELERKGNDYCRRTWLKTAPAEGTGARPMPGSDISCYKRFVIDAYENKRYYGEDDGAFNDEARPTTRPPPLRQLIKTKAVAKAPMSAPLPPVADLLDFSAPTSFAPGTSQNTTVQTSVVQNPPASARTSFQPVFQANFDSQFNSTLGSDLVNPTKPPQSSGTTIQSNKTNLFKADFDSQFTEAPTINSNAFQPSFGANLDSKSNDTTLFNAVKPVPAPALAGPDLGFSNALSSKSDFPISSDFDGLLTLNTGKVTAPKAKKPIMGTGGNSNASAISMMSGTTPQANIPMQMQQLQPQVMTQMQQQMAGTNYSQQQFQMSQQQMMTMMNNQNMMSMNIGGMNNRTQNFGANSMHSNAMHVGLGSQGNLMYNPMFSQEASSLNQPSENNGSTSIGNTGFKM